MADGGRQYLLYADEDLMPLVEADDPEAFAAIYDRHGRMAYSLAYRMMGEKQEAEDVVQEAFIKVWRSAGGYRVGRASVRTWILSIVRNSGLDHIRSRASRSRVRGEVEVSAPTSEPSDAFDEAWRNTQQEQVREALNTIPREQLTILEMSYFSGHTHAEIAERLELPLGTVKGRMRLGLQKLRGYYQERGEAVPR